MRSRKVNPGIDAPSSAAAAATAAVSVVESAEAAAAAAKMRQKGTARADPARLLLGLLLSLFVVGRHGGIELNLGSELGVIS